MDIKQGYMQIDGVHERLREARRIAGFERRDDVQAELGSGFSVGSLHRWETGKAEPPFDRVARLAELYGVSLDWIAGRTGCRYSHQVDHGKVIVDADGLERIDGLTPGKPIPDSILGPRFHCVWSLPARFVVLHGDAARNIETRLEAKVRELRGRGTDS